jgi:FkbM family methyltransferase
LSVDDRESDLCVRLANGTQLLVPSSLNAITTYVVLEQERWFEKEWGFIAHLLQPGMTAIDIGANLGIFSVAMAKEVGPTGKVFAYEPTTETRQRLERSRELNGFDNLIVLDSALSDTEREGRIVFGASSELNRLGNADGEGEAVHLTSLDIEQHRHGWSQVDFIKIDAEGEELPILRGGGRLFAGNAPLVMFEITSGDGFDPALPQAFEAMGFGIYRLLPDEMHLVPFRHDEFDAFELNLFAAKPERARELAARGLLIESAEAWEPSADMVGDGLAKLRSEPFAADFVEQFAGSVRVDADHAKALAAYDFWRSDAPLAARYGALRYAFAAIDGLCRREASFARLSSLARIAHDAGQRRRAVWAVTTFLDNLGTQLVLDEPFLPACERFEALDPQPKKGEWLIAAVVERCELDSKHSSYYGQPVRQLEWLCSSPYASSEMVRRYALCAAVRGRPAPVPDRLTREAGDHRNAALWQQGMVPGTSRGG